AWGLRKQVDEQTAADVTRLFTMSATDLLDRWFETPQMKGFMAVNGIIGTWAGPDAPGTAYVLMHHSVGDIGDGEVASWGFMEGGMGAVAEACEASATFFGAEVRVNAGVKKITTRDARVTGVVLDSGDELRAPLVITAIHPKITFLQQLERSELAPEGIHTVSMFSQWAQAAWADDEDDHWPELEAYADRLIQHFDDVAPGFKDSVKARQIIGPKQMQEGWDLIGGNIFHGELTVD